MRAGSLHAKPITFKRLGHEVIDQYGIKKKKVTQVEALSEGNYNDELYRIKTSRIVDPFPDELIIQEKTISVIRRQPFVAAVDTMPVKDIGRVVYVNSVLFCAIEVLGKNTAHDLRIKGLNKKQALKAKQIIEGLLLEDQGDITMPSWIQAEQHRAILTHIANDPENPSEPHNLKNMPKDDSYNDKYNLKRKR